MKTKSVFARINIGKVIVWVVILSIAIIWVVPFVFMVLTSLKSAADVQRLPAFAPPTVFTWSNYPDAIQRVSLLRAIENSFIIAIIKVPLGLLVSALAAFAIARLRVPRPHIVLGLFVLGTMVPIQVTLSTLFRIELALGLLSTKVGVILPYIAFGVPYGVFMFHGFFQSIPIELDEAARIDGASSFRIFWSIILPLAKPAIAALFILDFVATWNEYGIALVVLQKQASWTVPLALQNFNTTYQTLYGPLNAAIIMSILPALILYLMFQRFFVQGIFAGSIKG